MEYKKSELTQFAKQCAWAVNQMSNGVCTAGEIAHSDIGREINNFNDNDLLLEISKRYAKYAKDYACFDVDNGETQDFQSIANKIVNCCEDHDWFE